MMRAWILFVLLLLPLTAQATFSIVARDPQTGELGVAVQSRVFDVGSGVAWAEAGVGAIATQSNTNESFGPRGLAMLRSGLDAGTVLQMLLEADEGRPSRQVGIVDARGRATNHTGNECQNWAGQHAEVDLAAQGNILAGPAVVEDMVRAFHETEGELSLRLLAALQAGQAAGGDTRGMQSAALLVVRPSDSHPEYRTRYVDLRVHDHPNPIDELERLFRMHQAGDLLRAHVRYASEFEAAGQRKKAQLEYARVGQALKQTLAREEASASTLNALAWYCATADLYLDESLEAAERAAALEPENTSILDTLAEVQFRRGSREEAERTILRALELAPGDPYLTSQYERFRGE